MGVRSINMIDAKKLSVVLLVISVVLIAGCTTAEQPIQDYDTTPEPIIPDITGNTVVAVVNNEEITHAEISEMQQWAMQQGYQISQEEAIEQMINQKLLYQVVRNEGYEVTTEEVEEMLEFELMLYGSSLEEYKQQLQMFGMSYEEQLELMKEDMAVQYYLEEKFGDSIEVTTEEVEEFYNLYAMQSPEEDFPSLEEVEEEIEWMLMQQRQQDLMNVLIYELRENADIEYK